MRKLILLLVLSVSLLSFTSFASARNEEAVGTNTQNGVQNVTQGSTQNMGLSSALQIQRCERVRERVETRLNGFDKNQEKHVLRYQNMEKRLSLLAAKLKSFGLDTKKLESDIKSLESKVLQYQNSYNQFTQAMKGAQNVACDNAGTSKGFNDNVDQAKGYLNQAKTDALGIHAYILETIKEDLSQLKIEASKLK